MLGAIAVLSLLNSTDRQKYAFKKFRPDPTRQICLESDPRPDPRVDPTRVHPCALHQQDLEHRQDQCRVATYHGVR